MERRIRPEILWIVLISFLSIPLLYISLANIYPIRSGVFGPERIQMVRFGELFFSLLCGAAAIFLERRATKISGENGSPHVIFVLGLLLLISPSCLALFLFLLGNPRSDLYLLAVFSFSGILAWSWRRRDLFRPVPGQDTGPGAERAAAKAPPGREIPARALHLYTILLIVVGFFILAVLGVRILVSFYSPENSSGIAGLNPPVVAYEILMMLGCWTTAFLRKRRSRYARKATTVISAMLIPGFPLGTAIFFLWFAWVRKKVNPEANCGYF